LAPAAEPVRRGATLLVPPLDEPGADLRGDEPLALEDPDRVPAEPDEQRRNDVVRVERLEQRPELDVLVHARVCEAERRPNDDRLVRRLDPHLAVCVGRAAGPLRERSKPLANVFAPDEAIAIGHGGALESP